MAKTRIKPGTRNQRQHMTTSLVKRKGGSRTAAQKAGDRKRRK